MLLLAISSLFRHPVTTLFLVVLSVLSGKDSRRLCYRHTQQSSHVASNHRPPSLLMEENEIERNRTCPVPRRLWLCRDLLVDRERGQRRHPYCPSDHDAIVNVNPEDEGPLASSMTTLLVSFTVDIMWMMQELEVVVAFDPHHALVPRAVPWEEQHCCCGHSSHRAKYHCHCHW